MFIFILIVTVLGIAGCAAYFSIYGLAAIFSGAFAAVVTMGIVLETGKLVAASFVYRFWKKITFLMKTYLIVAIITLMLITSVGIFGFLSAAYQQDVLPLEEMETQIKILDQRKLEIADLKQEQIEQRDKLDAQIAAIPGNHSTNRGKFFDRQKEERDLIAATLKRLDLDLLAVTEEHNELRTKVIHQKVHTGPIVFIAKALGQPIDDATAWMIVLIMFAFDPLAVVLTIGANIALLDRTKRREEDIVAEEEEVTEQPIEEEEDVVVEVQEEPTVDPMLSEIMAQLRDIKDIEQQEDPRIQQILDQMEEMQNSSALPEDVERLIKRQQVRQDIRQ